ncbi:hypothetical protein J7L09_00675 [bacterium]|nr:hypothetical protein [bacterium]
MPRRKKFKNEYVEETCPYCGRKFLAWHRSNRPNQKYFFCCREHYFKSMKKLYKGIPRGGAWTKEDFKRAGTLYPKKRQELKRLQIEEYGRKKSQNDNGIR